MATATVTSKGQITIPVDVRSKLNLKAGDKLDFWENVSGRYELVPRKGSIQRLKGILKGIRPAMTLEEIEEATAAGAAKGNLRESE